MSFFGIFYLPVFVSHYSFGLFELTFGDIPECVHFISFQLEKVSLLSFPVHFFSESSDVLFKLDIEHLQQYNQLVQLICCYCINKLFNINGKFNVNTVVISSPIYIKSTITRSQAKYNNLSPYRCAQSHQVFILKTLYIAATFHADKK